jgi:FMN-dependent oxidoreductase (nitrilotriacetate monooxygenase family)
MKMQANRKGQMKLGWLMSPVGNHPAAWLHPRAELRGANSFTHYVNLVRKAESAKFDFVFQADAAGARDGNMKALCRAPRFMNIWEPLSLLSALVGVTERIGLAGTMSTSYFEPYNLARQFASLDHLSGGRSAWNVVTSAHPAGGYNFGRDGLEDHALRYERAREFVEICFGLWDSWDDDAFVLDRESGVYFDPDKMHYLRHKGKFFSVRGPLNIARPPQGRPVIIQAGGSESGKELAAETAEVIFTRDASLDHARAFYADVKGRMARFGRPPDHLKIMAGLTTIVGRTAAEAEEKFQELQSMIHPIVGLEVLSEDLEGIDLSDLPLDEPIPRERIPLTANRHKQFFDQILRLIDEEHLTLRELYLRYGAARGGDVIRGTATQIADYMEASFLSDTADGFMLSFSLVPDGLDEFIELVVPELRRRGLFREEYEGATLRSHLGLPRPASRHQTAGTATGLAAE